MSSLCVPRECCGRCAPTADPNGDTPRHGQLHPCEEMDACEVHIANFRQTLTRVAPADMARPLPG
eukprot:scaffold4455_cov403-Prasinococcus_capsulatus_cf.AAC.1